MATSTKAFLIELYREYLEEASFLYEQRLGLLKDAEVTWKRIGEFEERFEAHIDGLVVGGDLALQVCTERALEGDFGELHAAVRVFCRQNRKEVVLRILQETDAEDRQKRRAVADALKHELPGSWQADFTPMLWDGDDKSKSLLATVFGFRRFRLGTKSAGLLLGASSEALPEVIRAIGRLGDRSAGEALMRLLNGDPEPGSWAAALALLRLGEEGTVSACGQRGRSEGWRRLVVGLGGGRSAARELLELMKSGAVDKDGLIALGLLGDPSAIPLLMRALFQPDLASTSALALQAITGANLIETAFIPDPVEPDELFESEREKLKVGQVPTRPDGRPYGTNVVRLSQNPKDWEKWWEKNGGRLNPEARYRYGALYSPAALLATLQNESSPHQLREFAAEELVIRYGCDFPFEPDMLVKEQESALAGCAQWVAQNESRFKPGEWYFAGRTAL